MIPIPVLTVARWFGANWKMIAAGIAVATLAWLLWSWNARGDKIDDLKKQVKDYQEVVAAQSAWHDETVAALERKAHDETERSDFENRAARENQADRAAGDGPIAPVLLNGMSRLRQRQAEFQARNPR